VSFYSLIPNKTKRKSCWKRYERKNSIQHSQPCVCT